MPPVCHTPHTHTHPSLVPRPCGRPPMRPGNEAMPIPTHTYTFTHIHSTDGSNEAFAQVNSTSQDFYFQTEATHMTSNNASSIPVRAFERAMAGCGSLECLSVGLFVLEDMWVGGMGELVRRSDGIASCHWLLSVAWYALCADLNVARTAATAEPGWYWPTG